MWGVPMELTECRCPNCNAVLNVDPNSEYITCEYCDTVFQREISAEIKGKDLAKKIGRYKENFKKNQDLNASKIQITGELNQKKTELDELNKQDASGSGGTLVAVIIIIISIIMGISEGEWKVAVFGPIIGIIVGCVIDASAKSKNEELQKQKTSLQNDISNLESELKKVEAELEKLNKSFEIDFISANYRTDEAMNYMKEVLQTGRAENMKEAYNLYDEYYAKEHKYDKAIENISKFGKAISNKLSKL